MTKIALITDQHFGVRKGAEIYHDYYSKFYDNVFFKTIIEHQIETIIDLGDTFDSRKSIDFRSLQWSKKNYYDVLEKLGIQVYTLVGNHTSFYKNTLAINTIDLLLEGYRNVTSINEPKTIEIDGLAITFLPWICDDNQSESLNLIKKGGQIAMGHLEISGFYANKHYLCEHGLDHKIFNKFDLVLSGHFHHRSRRGQIQYLGNPYQLYWTDYDDQRGFHIFDTETLELEFVPNPYNLFEKIYYEDSDPENFEHLKDKFVRLIINEKTDDKKFETYMKELSLIRLHDLKVIEEIKDLFEENVEMSDHEDTLTVLTKVLDETETELNKSTLKKIVQDVYTESLTLM